MINAVRSLHGYDSVEEMSVTNAWHAVGVGNQFVCPATVTFTNQVVRSNRTVVSCSNLNVENVTVTNGSKLILDAAGEVNIISDFDVDLGSEFEIK